MRLIDADALTDELIRESEADTSKSIQTSFAKSVCLLLCKALELQQTVDAVPVIRCKDCKYFDPPHVEKDGERHEYNEFPQEAFDLFGIGVTVTYGINVGGRCKYYNLCGYPEDKSVYVPANNYCGRAEPKVTE